MDAHYVSSRGDTLLIFDDKRITVEEFVQKCREAGVDPWHYYLAIKIEVDVFTFRDLEEKYK